MAKGFLSKKWNSDRREQKIEARLSQMKSQKDELISIADSFVSNHLFSYERASSKRPIIRDNDSEWVRDKDFWCPKRDLIIPDTIKSFNALTWFWLTPIPRSFCMDQPRSYFRPPLRFLLGSSLLVRTLTLANRMPKMRNTKNLINEDKVFYVNVTLQRGLDCGVCRLLVLATYCAQGRSFVCRHLC